MLNFKRLATKALALLLTSQMLTTDAAFVSTSGTKILDEYGQELFFNGINLGNWLVWEGYLMMGDFNYRTHTQFFNSLAGALGGVDKAADFEYNWWLNYVDEKAISDLADLGFNSVRVPFNFKLFYRDGAIVNDGFEFFDRVIDYCRTYGMYVLLDMHGAPGYQNPGDHADNNDSNANQPRDTVKFWDGDNVQLAASIWKHIAGYYKDEPVVWGYDLINEPVPQSGREFELLSSYIVMRDAIREVDNNHIIVAEGSWWGSDLTKIDWEDQQVQASSGITSQWDSNLVYQIHHYGPASGTYGREAITQRLNIPIFIGEYGESDESNLLAITDWAKQALEGYFPWSFKKMSHDRTLWTIPPNDAYNQVKAYINNGGSPPTHLYDDMITFAQVNIKNGHSSHEWHQGFYNAIKPTITCAEAASFPIPGTIQVEEWCYNNGAQLEDTTDSGGGSNIGFLNPGDYTEYNIGVASSGQYVFEARVASQNGSGQIDVQVDGTSLAGLSVPNTNGWQSWTTISTPISLSAGTHILRLAYPIGDFNLNWVSFTSSAGNLPTKAPTLPPATGCDATGAFSVPGQIEAEAFCEQSGVELENTSDAGGGQNIGFLDSGDYALYNIDVATSGDYTFEARVASEWDTGSMDVKVDGVSVASLTISNTGGWQSFTTLSTTVSLSAGSHRLRLDFPGGGFNLNWMKLTSSSPSPPTSPPTSVPTSLPTPQTTSDFQACLATNAELQAQIVELQERLALYETSSPTKSPTASPTAAPSPSPTSSPSEKPTTAAPTKEPTLPPTASPTRKPTSIPTKSPTPDPTSSPTPNPTDAPTGKPTTSAPTTSPTPAPSMSPSAKPSNTPTSKPTTASPTKEPTPQPSNAPTPNPTDSPSAPPTSSPTKSPTKRTANPIAPPSALPTPFPTPLPTTGSSPADCTSAPYTALPMKFEAEQYCGQQGVTIDGNHITDISNGGYIEYNINVPTSGMYTFTAYVWSSTYSGQINVQIDGVSSLWLSIGHSNGIWKTWSANTSYMNAGNHRLKVAFPQGGFMVDWISLNTGTNNPLL